MPRKIGSRIRPVDAQGALTSATALEMRARRMKYSEIARELGCCTEAARQAVIRQFERLKEENAESAEEVRQQELESLDELEQRVLAHALSADVSDPQTLAAVDRVLRIKERRARLLGLDAKGGVEVAAVSGDMAVRIYVPNDGSGPDA